jgi:hypothetical protein
MSFAPAQQVDARSDTAQGWTVGAQGKAYAASMSSELWRLPGDDGLAHSQGFLCLAGFTWPGAQSSATWQLWPIPGQRVMCTSGSEWRGKAGPWQ